jgi:hypothetical protein
MAVRSFFAAFCLSFVAHGAQALVVSYDYQTGPMSLVQVPGGYSAPQFSGTLPDQKSFGFGFSLDLDALGGRIANTQIAYRSDGMGAVTATATRNGRTIAVQDSSVASWMLSTFPTETFGASLQLGFDALGNVGAWAFGTDGEGASYSFGSPQGDMYVFATIFDWTPSAPVWQSSGPGTWTHSALPAPIPVTPGSATLAGGLAALALAARRRSRRTARNLG